MTGYRLFMINGRSGHIINAHEFYAQDDATAVEIANDCQNGCAMELWHERQKVKRWEAALRALPPHEAG